MKLCSLTLDVAAHTRKIIKNDLDVFERGENLQQNGIYLCILDKSIVRNQT